MAQYPNNQDAGGIWKLKDIWVAISGENWVKDLSGDRGLFGGGDTDSAYLNVIEYITIANTGNTTDFGDLLANTGYLGAASNGNGGLQ